MDNGLDVELHRLVPSFLLESDMLQYVIPGVLVLRILAVGFKSIKLALIML